MLTCNACSMQDDYDSNVYTHQAAAVLQVHSNITPILHDLGKLVSCLHHGQGSVTDLMCAAMQASSSLALC